VWINSLLPDNNGNDNDNKNNNESLQPEETIRVVRGKRKTASTPQIC